MKNSEKISKAFKAAFPHTVPIMAGFLFLGFAYGIYMDSLGFSFVYPLVMSIVIYGGSLEFVAASMLLGRFDPAGTFILALLIQARHLFYGIAMRDKYKGMGIRKFFFIYGLSDETFAVNSSADIPEDVDKAWFYAFVTELNRLYWVAGALAGGLAGTLISVELKGLDFVMTAMFAVIFLDRWLSDRKHYSALIGVISTVLCLTLFGADSFMIPAMALITVLLCAFEKKIGGEEA